MLKKPKNSYDLLYGNIHFIIIFALLKWSETKPTILPRRACNISLSFEDQRVKGLAKGAPPQQAKGDTLLWICFESYCFKPTRVNLMTLYSFQSTSKYILFHLLSNSV